MDELMNIVERAGGIGFMPFLINKEDEHNWNDPEVIHAVQNRIRLPYYGRISKK